MTGRRYARAAKRDKIWSAQIPTGTYLDMTANMPVVHPEKVLAPVLLITGEFDGNSTLEDSLEFYRRLPNGDRQFVLLANTAHSTTLSLNRKQVWHAVSAFLSEPLDATSPHSKA